MPVMTTSRAALGPILALGFTALGFVAQGFMAQGLPARAADAPIRVNTFPNAKALPVYVGIARGFFARYGLSVEVEHTESSQSQRDGLAAGRFQIAQAALDNAVAMIEVARRDVVIVSGGDSGMNEFFVQPGIASFADLRGKTIVVDAPDTAYALQAKKLLLRNGLREGTDYTVKQVGAVVFRYKAMIEDKSNAGGILNLPFTVEAAEKGLTSLGRLVDLLGRTRLPAPSSCAHGRATTARNSKNTSPATSCRCGGSATPPTAPRRSISWSTSSSSSVASPSAPMTS
jgi:ABC-type nitrate/sulfonate/bicarbonate transport system substrate-binding protein